MYFLVNLEPGKFVEENLKNEAKVVVSKNVMFWNWIDVSTKECNSFSVGEENNHLRRIHD